MRGRRARSENARHGARRATQRKGGTITTQEMQEAVKKGLLLMPQTMLAALALERAECALGKRLYEDRERGPARTARIEEAWQALERAAEQGAQAVAEWYNTSTGAASDAMAWMQGYDVIERVADDDEEVREAVMAFGGSVKRAIVGPKDAEMIEAHARAVIEWDPLGTRPIADPVMSGTAGGLASIGRWDAIRERSEDEDSPAHKWDWEDASARTGLAAWAAAADPEQREIALYETFIAGDGLSEIEGEHAEKRIKAMMRGSEEGDPELSDSAMIEGLMWLSAKIEDSAQIERGLDAVRWAGAHRWKTDAGARWAWEILDRAAAIEGAARCLDRLKTKRSKRHEAQTYARWAECATGLGAEGTARKKWGRALTLDGSDAAMWRAAAATSMPLWRLAIEHAAGPSRQDRKLWGAWALAQGKEAAARIAGIVAAASAPRGGGDRTRRRTQTKRLRERLARETKKARARGERVEPRVLWAAAHILQDDASTFWQEGLQIERALLEQPEMEDDLAAEVAMFRLVEGRGIEPALEHLMAYDTHDDGGRCAALGLRISEWTVDDPCWENMARVEEAQGQHMVMERGVRGPAHQRKARKASYVRDAEWTAQARERCRRRYGESVDERLWGLLEQIAKAELRIVPTHWTTYQNLLWEMGNVLAASGEADDEDTMPESVWDA